MAPNQKRTQLHLTSVGLNLVQPLKTAFPPLTSYIPSTPPSSIVAQQDSSDYWEWSSENDGEINEIVDEERLSADHLVDNILRLPAVAPSTTCESNDHYWDWSHAKKESTDYWDWSANEQPQSTIESDSYWAW